MTNHENDFEEYLDVNVIKYNYEAGSPLNFEVLETHLCSDAELGLDDTNSSKFYSMNEKDKSLVQLHRKNFRCFDNSRV